jgi:hypothetical protein
VSTLIHEELSGTIIGIAMEVLNELKPGLDEKLYERAMVIELRRRGHVFRCAALLLLCRRLECFGLFPQLFLYLGIRGA